jgi:hypothetical protein
VNKTLSSINRNDVYEFLVDNIIEVTFTKVDGTERKMNCTLNYDYIPEDKKPQNLYKGEKIMENLDILKVFDTDKQDWRSFRVANVILIKT